MVRATGSYPVCRGFESPLSHHSKKRDNFVQGCRFYLLINNSVKKSTFYVAFFINVLYNVSMKNKSDTNLLRYYCNCHKEELFDVDEVHNGHFKELSPNTFRKYVSRLVEEHKLQPISKGLYFIGQEIPNNIDELILRYFCKYKKVHFGNSLLYELNIISDKPEFEEIRCSKGLGNRHVRGFYLKPLTFSEILAPRYLLELVELISLENTISEDNEFAYMTAIGDRVKQYRDSDLSHLSIEYRRIVYIKLANLLSSLHISNTVMQWYEYHKGFSN